MYPSWSKCVAKRAARNDSAVVEGKLTLGFLLECAAPASKKAIKQGQAIRPENTETDKNIPRDRALL